MSNTLSSSPVTIIVVIITILTITTIINDIKNEHVAAVRSCRRAAESSAHLLLGFRPARPFSSSFCRFCQKVPTPILPSSPPPSAPFVKLVLSPQVSFEYHRANHTITTATIIIRYHYPLRHGHHPSQSPWAHLSWSFFSCLFVTSTFLDFLFVVLIIALSLCKETHFSLDEVMTTWTARGHMIAWWTKNQVKTFSLPIWLAVRLMCLRNHTLHLPVFMFYLNALNAFMGNWVLQCLLFTSVCEKYLQNVRKCVYLHSEYAKGPRNCMYLLLWARSVGQESFSLHVKPQKCSTNALMCVLIRIIAPKN